MAPPHCLEKDVFQRIAFITKAPDLQLPLRCYAVQVLHVNAFLHHKLQAVLARDCVFTSKFCNCFDKPLLVASCFEHQELSIRFSFFFEIAIDGNLSLTQDQDFITTLFDIKQQVRRKYQMSLTTISDFSNQLDHS